MVNGIQRGRFEASRGLRRGDPWLPFISTSYGLFEMLMDIGIERCFVKGFMIGNGVSVSTCNSLMTGSFGSIHWKI